MSAVVLLAQLKIAPGQMDTYLARVRRHRSTVLETEAGCRQFDIVAAREGENEADYDVVLYEVYDDDAALELHRNTAHMKSYLADTKPMVMRRDRILCDLINE